MKTTTLLDSFDAPYWNSCQVRLWIAYRDPELVRRYKDEPKDGLTAEILYGELPDVPICKNYEQELLTALQTGKIKATGLKNSKGEPKGIPIHHWPYLCFVDAGGPMVRHTGTAPIGSTAWTQLKFLRREIFTLWPIPGQAELDHIHSPDTESTKRNTQKRKTKERHASWKKAYRTLKRQHPKMSDTWCARKIEKMEVAENRTAETIRKNMK